MKINWVLIVTILIILGGIGFAFISKTKSKPAVPQSLYAKEVPLLGREHVDVGTKVEYNSNPPTSGNHYGTWAKNGVHDKPEDDGFLVHSLEHGYIIVSYNCEMKSQDEATGSAKTDETCLSFVDKLKDFVNSDSWKMILIPRPSLDTNFALTSWGQIDKFTIQDANLDRVKAFKEAFRNHGPEQTME